MEKFRVLYAPDGADGGGTPAAAAPAAEAKSDGYADNFGVEETVSDNMFDPDNLEKTEPISFDDEPQTVPENNEEQQTEGEEAQPQKPAVDATELDRIKQEYEQYKQTERERFEQFYQSMEAQKKASAAPVERVEQMFANPEFVEKLEQAEDGKDVAKLIMSETVKMTQDLLKTQLAPVFHVVQQYQQEQVQTRVNNIINEFKGKYGVEADKALTPNTPENKALLNELQQNPNLSLEKAFLLIRPNFVKQQVSQEVKKAIDEKKANALPLPTGKSAQTATKKVDSIEDALNMALNTFKKTKQN